MKQAAKLETQPSDRRIRREGRKGGGNVFGVSLSLRTGEKRRHFYQNTSNIGRCVRANETINSPPLLSFPPLVLCDVNQLDE